MGIPSVEEFRHQTDFVIASADECRTEFWEVARTDYDVRFIHIHPIDLEMENTNLLACDCVSKHSISYLVWSGRFVPSFILGRSVSVRALYKAVLKILYL
jgi:hypothetical protein